MLSAPADNNHISMQPRVKARQVPGSGCGVRSPDGVQNEKSPSVESTGVQIAWL
jgi:hypothetical protein